MATETEIHKSDQLESSGQFSTFFVSDLFFGVDVLNVQEVLRFHQMTPVAARTVPMAAPPIVTSSAG
jgi:chemotaxis signal transduction protein